MSIAERFWSKVNKTEGCWQWTAAIDNTGYGVININKKKAYAHRIVFYLTSTIIPEGLVCDHLCRNRSCVNPTHIEFVTRGENVLRGIAPTANHARKTLCKRGHPYDRAYPKNSIKQARICSICHSIDRKKYARKSRKKIQ